MLARMDLAASSAGPWLVLGIAVGVLLAGLLVLAVAGLRRRPRADPVADADQGGWSVDDLPGFLEHPPGVAAEVTPAAASAEVRLGGSGPVLLDARRRSTPLGAPTPSGADRTPRLLIALSAAAVLLIGAAAAVAATTAGSRGAAATAPAGSGPAAESATPSWTAPDVSGVPASPSPGDPGAGRLAAASVPVGPDGAVARAAFEGLVLERRAVGVTAAYPVASVTASDVPGGPALAHVRLDVWNCLRDAAPADPEAAGCRRLPTEHAELGTPALRVSSDGEGLRISGRFPTYVRPAGSPPAWTGRAYPLTVTWTPAGTTLHLGTERATALDERGLTDLRLGR